jgi:dihydrodipicolinate synthase/N-acetylneuraminate lyase
VDSFEQLSERERAAVVEAAVWYAKHHTAIIAGSADDRSAMAVARRERFQDLYDGLAKLGVRLVRPDGLRPAA